MRTISVARRRQRIASRLALSQFVLCPDRRSVIGLVLLVCVHLSVGVLIHVVAIAVTFTFVRAGVPLNYIAHAYKYRAQKGEVLLPGIQKILRLGHDDGRAWGNHSMPP